MFTVVMFCFDLISVSKNHLSILLRLLRHHDFVNTQFQFSKPPISFCFFQRTKLNIPPNVTTHGVKLKIGKIMNFILTNVLSKLWLLTLFALTVSTNQQTTTTAGNGGFGVVYLFSFKLRRSIQMYSMFQCLYSCGRKFVYCWIGSGLLKYIRVTVII